MWLLGAVLAASLASAQAQTIVKVENAAVGKVLTRFWQSDTTWGVKYETFQSGNGLQEWYYDEGAKTVRTRDNWCLSGTEDLNSNVVIATGCNGNRLRQWERDASGALFHPVSQKCLDADVGSGQTVQLYPCNRNAPGNNQKWNFVSPTPPLEGYFIQVYDQGAKCLDLDGGRAEADVDVGMWPCDANAKRHRWVYDYGTGQIKYAANKALCLDAPNLGESGRVLVYWCSDSNPNQQFDVLSHAVRNGATSGWLQLHNTNWCLQVYFNDLILATCSLSLSTQVFSMDMELPSFIPRKPLLEGYFIQIRDEGKDKCLDLDNGKAAADTDLGMWPCNYDAPQHRWIYDVTDNSIKYKLNTALCVDAPQAGEGDRVLVYWCSADNQNQKFDVVAPQVTNGYTKGQLQLRSTNWCLQVSYNDIIMAKCEPYAANQVFSIGTKLTSLVGKCGDNECKNGGVCVNGACQCRDGWTDAGCGTKTNSRVGLETSDGYLLTVSGKPPRELTYEVPDSTGKPQQFLFDSGTKRLRVDGRLFCVDGGANSTSLAPCSSSGSQQWVYDVTKGTVKQPGANACLEAASGRIVPSTCSPETKPGQVWVVSEDIFNSNKLIRHRSSLSSCLTVDSGVLAVKTCDLKHRIWRHEAASGAGQLSVSGQCLRAVQRSLTTGTLAIAPCDAQPDRSFEYDTSTGLIRAFQTTLCVSLSTATSSVSLVSCDAKDPTQRWYLPRRDQCLDDAFLANMDQCGANEKRGQCAFSGCQCAAGYSGKRCEYETCSATQCSNGGTCTKGKCTCADGFAGPFCDDFVKCVGVACRNGGVCNAKGACDCPVGFSGDRCTVRHPKVVVRTLAYRAIGVVGGRVAVVEPNARNKDHVWWWDSAKSMLRSVGRPTNCLERTPTGEVTLGACDATQPPTQQWRYDAAASRLRTGDDRGTVRYEALAAGLRVVVLQDGTSAPSNTTIVRDFRVDIDRLDLPGTPVYDDSGKCLTVTGSALSFTTCDPNSDAQQWEYTPQNGLVRAALLDGFMCLSMNGATVSAQRCNGDDAAQKFRYDWETQRLRHRQSRQCVSAAGLAATACDSAAPLHMFFRSFCDVIKLCGQGECVFERCVCPPEMRGPFCTQRVQ
jgi:hypothetical protein